MNPDGRVRCGWADILAGLEAEGEMVLVRRSAPFQMMPTGLFGPGGIFSALFDRLPVSSSDWSYRHTGSWTQFFSSHWPYLMNCGLPGVIGNEATSN